jgi:phospho-N-acetylmuramoyl-pentapeptide-transferase
MPSIFVVAVLGVFAYVEGNRIYSSYLYYPFLRGAGELTFFGAAFVGACLGFLWYNAYPAQIFMGDTGSLAIGGALGTVAILTKQEFLLPFIGGVFILEALSVMLQVSVFKITKRGGQPGKRIFKMTPLHHHFEISGWKEPKIVFRFVIVAILFALLSLSTLKLR